MLFLRTEDGRVLLASRTGSIVRALCLLGNGVHCAAQVQSGESWNRPSAKAVAAEFEAYLRAWRDKDYSSLSQVLSDAVASGLIEARWKDAQGNVQLFAFWPCSKNKTVTGGS
jgi:predicted lipid-binding transport protein (Tim44 family)